MKAGKAAIRVAAIQMQVRVGDLNWNLKQAQAHLRRLASWQPDLVVFPESVLDGYACREPQLRSFARDGESPETAQIKDLARSLSTWILWTYAEAADGGIYNSAILIDREGEIRLKYHKVHLCAEVGEKHAYLPGDVYPVVDMEGLQVGVMICFDRHFPEVARMLALKGAQLILHPSATVWFKPDPGSVNTAMMRTRAYENRCFVLSVNQANYGGGSALFGPWGDLMALAGEGEEIMKLTINPTVLDQRPEDTFELMGVRRSETYAWPRSD